MDFIFPRNTSFLGEIRSYFKALALEVREIGDGLLAVKAENDFDIVFDTGRWKLTITIKEKYQAIIFPPELGHAGILPGKMMGGVADLGKIMLIVRQKLEPTSPHYKLLADKAADKFDFSEIFKNLGSFGDIFRF